MCIDPASQSGDSDKPDASDEDDYDYADYGFRSKRRKRRERTSDSPTMSCTGNFYGVVEYSFPLNYSDVNSSDNFVPSLSYVLKCVEEKQTNPTGVLSQSLSQKKDLFHYLLESEGSKVGILGDVDYYFKYVDYYLITDEFADARDRY